MSEKEETIIPDEFSKIIKDLVNDIQNTFPEMSPLVAKWWKPVSTFDYIDDITERETVIEKSRKDSMVFLFKFAQKKFPPRFFDILYENNEIFKEESGVDTEFLPHIHFKNLWQFDISEKTRETMWKYLQLITFSIIGSVQNKEAFGDSGKFYESLNSEDFKTKLEDTLSKMQGLFDMGDNPDLNDGSSETNRNIPNANDIHDHISGMLDGKLGKLAKEIAQETADNLNMDMDNTSNMKDVFDKMLKNPSQLMGLVKNVGDKLESRIKSGEIKESELISEAAQLMSKMKDMPGMDNIQSMLSKMGMPNLGKDTKMNVGAMQEQLNRNMKNAEMKERLKAKAESIRLSKEKVNEVLQKELDMRTESYIPLTEAEMDSFFENTQPGKTTDKNKKKNKKAKK